MKKFFLLAFNLFLYANMIKINLNSPCSIKNCSKCDIVNKCTECEKNYVLNENKCYSKFLLYRCNGFEQLSKRT